MFDRCFFRRTGRGRPGSEGDFIKKCFLTMGLRPMVTKIILGYIAASAGT
jgi:hypothetical protein